MATIVVAASIVVKGYLSMTPKNVGSNLAHNDSSETTQGVRKLNRSDRSKSLTSVVGVNGVDDSDVKPRPSSYT